MGWVSVFFFLAEMGLRVLVGNNRVGKGGRESDDGMDKWRWNRIGRNMNI